MTRIFILLLIVTACAAPQTADTKEQDSIATLSDDTFEMAEDGEYSEDIMPPADTVFVPVKIEKKHSRSQLQSDVAYVYAKEGLDVYSDAERKKRVGHIRYKEKVMLLDASMRVAIRW